MYIIYKHTSLTGKSYIGYTCQGLITRWNREISHSKNFQNKRKLDYAIRKYPNK